MEKRAVLAIVLSLLVVVIWSFFFVSPPAENPPSEQQEYRTAQRPSESPPPASQSPSPAPATLPDAAAAPPETAITVDTGVAQVILTNLGATIKAVQLHEFRATLEPPAPPVEIASMPGARMMPLTAELRLGQRSESLDQVAFVPSTTHLTLSETTPEGSLTFRGQTPEGVVVHRVYYFRHKSYAFEVSTRFENLPVQTAASMALWWGPGLMRQHQEEVARQGQTGVEARSYVNGKLHHEAPEKVGEVQVVQGDVAWTALADTYFAAVLIDQQPGADAVEIQQVREHALGVAIRTPLQGARPEQTVRVYVGPKKQELLEAADPSLWRLIDLGFFAVMARPMVHFLRAINSWVHNYGITIILVTALIKLVFWPLTQKSYKSMQAMQQLQPEIKKLQTIYKDDRQGMNQAMMKLYREQKVNPMGGCLPMLLQIPFFFAFYNALLYSIELRHAPFVCWDQGIFWIGRGICDLSVHDPSYITPVLMGVSMFIQQKMTPTTGDPTQAKVMQFMPLIFLFFFLKAPAGLVIYWLVNNLLSIGQQLLVNRTRPVEPAPAETAG